jgi:hypothetical protein
MRHKVLLHINRIQTKEEEEEKKEAIPQRRIYNINNKEQFYVMLNMLVSFRSSSYV